MKYTPPQISSAEVLSAPTLSVLLSGKSGFSGARRRILTMKRLVCLGNFAADNPLCWKANVIHYLCPEMPQSEIAGKLHVDQKSVSRYLSRCVPIDEDIYRDCDNFLTGKEN